MRVCCALNIWDAFGSYIRGTTIAWISGRSHEGCGETLSTLTQLPAETSTGTRRAHAKGRAISVGVAASSAQWPAEETLKTARMQPMTLQLCSNLAIQEAVQDCYEEALQRDWFDMHTCARMNNVLWKVFAP